MSSRELEMMLAVTSAFTTIPPDGALDQWLADVDVTTERFAGDTEALSFLNHLRSSLVLMKALADSGRHLTAAASVLSQHVARYEEMRDAEDRKLLIWRDLWDSMRDDFGEEN